LFSDVSWLYILSMAIDIMEIVDRLAQLISAARTQVMANASKASGQVPSSDTTDTDAPRSPLYCFI
jgi:hypothetical protein